MSFATLVRMVLSLCIGLGLGWSMGKVFHIVRIPELELPKPVTPPPQGYTWVQVLTTGYCPCPICCGPFANGHTSINRDVRVFPFGVAVAPTMIPYHTVVDIPGYGIAEVDDTGGAMRQDANRQIVHLDLRFVTHQEALKWGRRRMWIALPLGVPATRLQPQVSPPVP